VKGLAAALAIAAGIGVIAVGHDGQSTSAHAAVKRALARTVDADSSRFTISWAMPALPVQFPYDYRIEGLMDYAHHRGRISYGFGNETLLDGDVEYSKWPMRGDTTRPGCASRTIRRRRIRSISTSARRITQ
jgi:hypothetical protein